MAELADALASGASGRKVVEVRVLSWAPFRNAKIDFQFEERWLTGELCADKASGVRRKVGATLYEIRYPASCERLCVRSTMAFCGFPVSGLPDNQFRLQQNTLRSDRFARFNQLQRQFSSSLADRGGLLVNAGKRNF